MSLFILSSLTSLDVRKLTGWEHINQDQLFDIIDQVNRYSKTLFTPFITWPKFKNKFDERFPLKKIHQTKNGSI